MEFSFVIYEVNLKVQNDIIEAYLTWLRAHIVELLKIDGFLSVEIFYRKPQDEGEMMDEQNTYLTVQYKVDSRQSLDNYFKDHAARFREDGIKRFGGKFSASRRILSFSESFKKN